MSRKAIRPWIFAVLACGIGLLTWAFWPPSVNDELRRRQIPEIPSYESLIGVESGGFSAHWLFVAVRVNDDQMEQYELRLNADDAEHLELGTDTGQVQIVEVENYSGPTQFNKMPRIYLKQSLHGQNLEWWKIDKATRGDFFDKALPEACGYQVILDREHRIIYIYWHYS